MVRCAQLPLLRIGFTPDTFGENAQRLGKKSLLGLRISE
jgi:hypothetical protein